jgi:hypothetical protein
MQTRHDKYENINPFDMSFPSYTQSSLIEITKTCFNSFNTLFLKDWLSQVQRKFILFCIID